MDLIPAELSNISIISGDGVDSVVCIHMTHDFKPLSEAEMDMVTF